MMKPAQNTTPADFGVWEVAYKVSETDFNMKRSLAKAPVNEWAHQDDVVNVKTQQVVRENQDVIYSSAVVDIREGATISVPKSDNYHIIQILDMQNYTVEVLYPGESAAITPDRVTYGSYVYLNMRIRKLPEEKGGLPDHPQVAAHGEDRGEVGDSLRLPGHRGGSGDPGEGAAGAGQGRLRGQGGYRHEREHGHALRHATPSSTSMRRRTAGAASRSRTPAMYR